MKHRSKYFVCVLALTVLALAAACGSDADQVPLSGQTRESLQAAPVVSGTESSNVPPATTAVLAAGEFQLPAAGAFGEPGFHEVLSASFDPPAGQSNAAGKKLVLKLWDAGRPGQNCGSEHPLSGCATVDWSDAPGRPNVPSGGVFENSITLDLGGEERVFFLNESGDLKDSPEAFDPG